MHKNCIITSFTPYFTAQKVLFISDLRRNRAQRKRTLGDHNKQVDVTLLVVQLVSFHSAAAAAAVAGKAGALTPAAALYSRNAAAL